MRIGRAGSKSTDHPQKHRDDDNRNQLLTAARHVRATGVPAELRTVRFLVAPAASAAHPFATAPRALNCAHRKMYNSLAGL